MNETQLGKSLNQLAALQGCWRRGGAVQLDQQCLYFAVENFDFSDLPPVFSPIVFSKVSSQKTRAAAAPDSEPTMARLLMTHERAAAIGLNLPIDNLSNPQAGYELPIALSENRDGLGMVAALSNPLLTLPLPERLRVLVLHHANDAAEIYLMRLLMTAGLFPMLLAVPLSLIESIDLEVIAITRQSLLHQNETGKPALAKRARLIASAKVPLSLSESQSPLNAPSNAKPQRTSLQPSEISATVSLYRTRGSEEETIVITIGKLQAGEAWLVRLHSSCATGDLFGSLRCDCGEQLNAAKQYMAAQGGGVILYLPQEGRGIGLANKLRAYCLQDRGMDTLEANRQLGLPADLRDYGTAAAILHQLGAERLRLLTNNPTKITALQSYGLTVVERVAHQFPSNQHNRTYLATKERDGHFLTEDF